MPPGPRPKNPRDDRDDPLVQQGGDSGPHGLAGATAVDAGVLVVAVGADPGQVGVQGHRPRPATFQDTGQQPCRHPLAAAQQPGADRGRQVVMAGDAQEQASDLGKLRGDRSLEAFFPPPCGTQLIDNGAVLFIQPGQDGGDVPFMAFGLIDGNQQQLGHAGDGRNHDGGPPLAGDDGGCLRERAAVAQAAAAELHHLSHDSPTG